MSVVWFNIFATISVYASDVKSIFFVGLSTSSEVKTILAVLIPVSELWNLIVNVFNPEAAKLNGVNPGTIVNLSLFVPEIDPFPTFNSAFPVFSILKRVSLMLPVFILPKLMDSGLILNCGAMQTALRAMVNNGAVASLELIISAAVLLPLVLGLKVQ